MIDDILEKLRKEEISVDEALADIRQQLAENPQDADGTALLDRVDQSQQAGLPAPHANAIRDLLLDETVGGGSSEPQDSGGGADDDMMELTLEPSTEPERPVSGYDITDGTPPPDDSDQAPEPPADEAPAEPPATEPGDDIEPLSGADMGSDAEPGADTGADSDDHGLPPINPFAQDPSQETKTAEEPPPEADDTIPLSEGSEGRDQHEVVMETRDNLPSSSERGHRDHNETISERAVTTTTIIGALLGGRFELLTRISQDPYGTFYRARDHERDDANPETQLCGVRVLPSSLARQEMITKRVEAITKRIGRLKHRCVLKPIALHRDEEQAWVVTQLPVGSTLARFIRRECVSGLPAPRALAIVRQIGEAIASAHERRIPHGDLKPSSIFISDKDRVQVADFGMRTALYGNKGLAGVAGSTEIEQMDPIEAYLSLEIMEGAPPEPADDIYALACIAACLLTGGHPFNGQSGLRRMKSDTPVPKIKSLTRHQNQVLRKALAPYRKERPESVTEFLDQLETERGKASKLPLIIGAAVLAAVAAAWFPAMNYLEQREQQHMIEDLRDAGWPGMRGQLRTLDPEDRRFALEELATSLPAQYAREVEYALEDGDLLEARSLLDEALSYYSGHDALMALDGQVSDAWNAQVDAKASGIRELLDAGLLGEGEGDPDLAERFEALRLLEPQHELAEYDNLRPYFEAASETAAGIPDPDKINRLHAAAVSIFPDDDAIHGVMTSALAQAEDQASDRVSEQLAPALAEQMPPESLGDVRAIRSDWQLLLRMAGSHPLIETHEGTVADLVERGIEELMNEQSWLEANELLRELSVMVPSNRLEDLRQQLSRAQLLDDYRPASLRAERQGLSERRAQVEDLLDQPRMTPVWSGELIIAWRDMIGWLRPGRNWLPDLREKVERTYLEAIAEAQATGEDETVARLAREGLQVLPTSRDLREYLAEETPTYEDG